MKKSQKLYTIGVLSVVLSTLVFINVSCAVDTLSDRNISLSYEHPNSHCLVIEEQKIQSTTFYDETNDCYSGQLANMFTAYNKCQIVAKFQFDEPTDDFCISSDFFTNDNGVRARLVANFYYKSHQVFTHNYNGQLLLSGEKITVSYPQKLEVVADAVEISVQAYYESAKGGSSNCVLYYDNLTVVTNNDVDKNIDNQDDTFIYYDQSQDCYVGQLTDLRVDYSKSEVITDKIKTIEDKTIKLQGLVSSQTIGDYIRLIARYYDNDNIIDKKIYTGLYVDNTIDLDYVINCSDNVDFVDIVVQAKYDSNKGGTKQDVICIDKLYIKYIDNDENVGEDNNNVDENNDENINQLIDYDESTDSWFGTFCNLKSTYPELGLSTDLIYIGDCTQDIVLTCDFISDNSGDYIRFIVDYYSIDHQLQQTVKYNGVLCQKNQICKFVKQLEKYDSQYITVTVQCKYDSKKGGTKQDTVQFNGLALISN